MITPHNLVRHELIGLEAEVAENKDHGCGVVRGMIEDETKNMILMVSGDKSVWFAKDRITLDISIPSGEVVRVEGRMMSGRPEDRIRKKLPGKWKIA
ncbi:MAG: ribonuclease P protein subunit [Candidatus Aenigmarchaeota archaeon]|nr:ribonuclease P protein subunit [Candidatus Aenigmarchaeota archaeon]